MDSFTRRALWVLLAIGLIVFVCVAFWMRKNIRPPRQPGNVGESGFRTCPGSINRNEFVRFCA